MGLKVSGQQDIACNSTDTDVKPCQKGSLMRREVTEKTSSIADSCKFVICFAALGALAGALSLSLNPKPYIRPKPSGFDNPSDFDAYCVAKWRDVCVNAVWNYQVDMPNQTESLRDYLSPNFKELNSKLMPDEATKTFIVASTIYPKDKTCDYVACRGSPTETEGPGKTCMIQYNPQYITPKIPTDFPKECFQKILFEDHHPFDPNNVDMEKSQYYDEYARKNENHIKNIECKFQVSHCDVDFESQKNT